MGAYKRPKCLITAGCSFSQVPNADVSWPVPLRDALHTNNVFYLGQGAAGNGIISRKVIYNVQQALDIYEPHEILVGIMWSGYDRFETYHEKMDFDYYKLSLHSEGYCNPVRITDEHNYYLINSHWSDELTKAHFKYFYDQVGATIQTLEHILRTQWFLKQHNIPYFMTEYSFDCLPRHDNIRYHADVGYLYDMIDKDKWLPIDNMWQYAVDSGLPFARPPDPHPSSEHHEKFVREVVLPWLHAKGYLRSPTI